MTFRSEQVTHYQLLFPREISWEVANQLGSIDCVHVQDISDPAHLIFNRQIKRCQQSLSKIRSIVSFMKKKKIVHETYQPELDTQFMSKLLAQWESESKNNKINAIKKIDDIQEKVEKSWNSYQQLTGRLDKLSSAINLNKGKMAVFAATSIALGKSYFGAQSHDNFDGFQDDLDDGGIDLSGLSYFVSIVKPQQEQRIAKMVFRVSRGYAWTNFIHKSSFQHIPQLQGFSDSVVFLFYPRSSQGIIAKKLKRIIQSFSTQIIDLPNSQAQFSQAKSVLNRQYKQTKDILNLINLQIQEFFERIKNIKALDEWFVFFLKQKTLYEHLNKMQIRDQFLTCRFYISKLQVHRLQKIMRMTPSPILNELSIGKAPSRFQSNLFLNPGQLIVQTYGIPRYGEMNPGVFTCVTFPFLFGVMFGDMAHGLVLFSFGLFLIFGAERLKGTAFNGFLQLRYMIGMMGFFAFYCGLMYNDFMGLGLNLFGSCYELPMYGPGQPVELSPRYQECTYPIGVDPVWYRTENQLTFINSLKMKISVIIGVIHMTFGIILKAVNSINFKKNLDLYCQFIPQILFMVLMFGYMDFLIVFKWLKYWAPQDTWAAPSIITTLINLPLKLGQTTQQLGGRNMWGNSPTDTSQNTIQLIILLISVICIPVMLIPKPWIEIRKMNSHKNKPSPLQQQLLDLRQSQITQDFQSIKSERNSEIVEQPHGDKGQIIVHQIIQTIEFILGCISNTASYLRLWALSLAHSQLSKVFFQKTIEGGFSGGYATIMTLIIGFYLLAYVTFGVLMCMDTMQCFLHALRLHWVQFQNKFFKADGIKFVQYSFKDAVVKVKSSD